MSLTTPLEIQVRPAQRDDVTFVSGMIQLSMGGLADYLFQEDERKIASLLQTMFLRNAGRFGSGIAYVAEEEGCPVGVLISCEGARVDALNLATLPHLFPVLGIQRAFRMIWKGIRLPGGREAGKDEYYISNIGVPPATQGRGIGSRLLAFAEQVAHISNLGKCSLIVGLRNPDALRLYQRLGYRIVETTHARNEALGYHRMVKVL